VDKPDLPNGGTTAGALHVLGLAVDLGGETGFTDRATLAEDIAEGGPEDGAGGLVFLGSTGGARDSTLDIAVA
jgi:hypothetical protein